MRHLLHESLQVSAGEIARNFGQWQDRALIHPVVVTHHGRPRVVLVSAEDYATAFDQDFGASKDSSSAPSDTRLTTLLENLTGAFVALDKDLNVVAVNHAFEVMGNRPAQQIVGQPWETCFPEARPFVAEHLRRALRTGESDELQMDSRVPGRIYYARIFAYPGGVAALIRNITAERELRSDAQRAEALRAALLRLPDIGTASLNIRGVFTQLDEGFARLTGFSLKDLSTARLIDIVRPSERHAVNQALERSLQGGGPTSFSATLLAKQLNEKPFEVSVAAIADDGTPEGLVGVFTSQASAPTP